MKFNSDILIFVQKVSAPHHNSPQRIDFDTLGRPFCTTDDNMQHGLVVTHNTLDIAGRPIALTDALGRVATTRIFALSEKHLLSVQNIDSGRRRMLSDVAGKPIGQWDSRGHRMRYTYDELQRPVAEYVSNNGQNEFLAIKNVYGSSAEQNNIGRIHQVYDQSGLTEFSSYDFKGNPLEQKKKFCQSYNAPVNWGSTPLLQDEVFTTSWTYNALNQPLLMSLPDGSSQQNTYNKAGLLETVSSNGQAYVTNINYNEKGQRSDIFYGNGSKTHYHYDKNTFRLIRLFTNRNDNNNDENVLQDIHYTYDPVGNIVEIVDNAHQEKYFNNAVIEPKGQYEYDALYRLVKATGRELSSLQLPTHSDFANNIPVPNMGNNAMQNYTQQFTYDELGNILKMKSVGRWTRDYHYDILHNNYLTGHAPRAVDYTYDEHGNMLSMPHLQSMHYDYQDQLNKVVLDASGNTAYYIYDAAGQRVRKVVEKSGGIKEERYYLGNYEVYRKFVGITLETERTTAALTDDKRKIATIDKLTVENSSLINLPLAVIRYQFDNHLGSASLELDASAQIISYEEYHPFGTTSYRSGRSETEVSLKRYKYVGKERDEETGLYYYGARYYAAWIGRFVSVDPLQFDYPQLTPFNYAGNKPVTHIDIDGMQSSGDKPYGTDLEKSGEIYVKGAIVENKFGKWVYQGDGNWSKSEPDNKLPWYLRENKHGGKPVLTLGIPKLPLAERNPNYSSHTGLGLYWNIGIFINNSAVAAWNGFASTLNDALDGKTSTEMLLETEEALMNITADDLLGVEFWENVGGGVLVGVLIKSAKNSFSKSTVNAKVPQAGPEVAAKGGRNSHLAGKVHPKTGVPFDIEGFPDFSEYLYKGGVNDVMIKPTGNRVADFVAANKAAGISSTPKGYTWHHHQTTGRMQLVETGVHSQTGHSGGFSLWKY